MIKKLSIIVPVYNEERIIEKSIREIQDYFREQPFDFEVIAVNDGSADRSGEILESLKIDFPKLIVLHSAKNQGKGAAVRKGMLHSKGDWVMFMDADLSTALDSFEKFLEHTGEYDIMIGSRALPESQILAHQFFLKEALGKTGNFFIKKLLGLNIKDTQCGFKMFSIEARHVFALQTLNGWGFDFEILAIAQERGFKIKELPVRWYNVKESKVKLIDYWHTLKDLLKVRRGMEKLREKISN